MPTKPPTHESRLPRLKRKVKPARKPTPKTPENASSDDSKGAGGNRSFRAQRFYNTAAWQRLRNSFKGYHPFCYDPFGTHDAEGQLFGEPGRELHHILAVETHPELRSAWSNLAHLCKSCHRRIERQERAGKSTADLFPDRASMYEDMKGR